MSPKSPPKVKLEVERFRAGAKSLLNPCYVPDIDLVAQNALLMEPRKVLKQE